MVRLNLICFGLMLLGFVLFLYGANFYDALVGWAGVFIFLGGSLAILLLYIYKELKKKSAAQNP